MRMRSLVLLAALSVTALAQTPSPAPAKPKAQTAPTAKKEEAPKIDGLVLTRPNGGFLGLKLEGGSFKLSFYDPERKPVPPDFPRALARWNPNYKAGSERVMLNQSPDGQALVGNRPVRPPYTFKLYLTLLRGEAAAEGDASAPAPNTESYVVDFRN